STFGIGGELDESEWRAVLRQLIAQDLVAVDHARHQVLVLTESSREVLRGERTVSMRRPEAAARRPRRRNARDAQRASASGAQGGAASVDALFERLREWRRATAAERGVPPYVIFPAATRRAIAELRPTRRAHW